jgi:hypothetical protein
VVSEKRIKTLIDRNRILNVAPGLDEVKARDLAVAVALNEAIKKHGIKKAIAYCASILAGKHACARQDALNKSGRWPETANFHVSSELTAGERADVIRKFEDAARPAIMYNARCLTEGVDIGTQKDRPVDAVAFTSPRRSVVDIVQAAGRAMRKGSKKKVGYVLIPIIVPDDVDLDKFAETTPFKEMARIIKALAIADPRIVDELRALYYGKVSSGKIIKIEGMPIGLRMPFDEFASALRTRVWNVVARGNYRPFEEARELVRGLGFKNLKAWHKYSKSDRRPPDIPSHPNVVYADKGWEGWADFVGYGSRRPDFLSFKQARTYVRRLGLDSTNQFRKWCKSGYRPSNIPTNPNVIYADAGWVSWGDFVGTKHRRGGWISFKEARAYARSLKLNSAEEWRQHGRARKLPNGIPADPYRAYKDKGWNGYGDWLGTKTVATNVREFWPFIRARAYVHRLGLNSHAEWMEHCRSGKRHHKIPASPIKVYAKAGWKSWPDWLGTKTLAQPWRLKEAA